MKKITGVIAMAVLSSAAFANTIVPETSRDGKTRNNSAIATSQEMRTFVAVDYGMTKYEVDTASDANEKTAYGAYGEWANKQFTIAVDLKKSDAEQATLEDEAEYYNLEVGYRLNDKLSFGASYTFNKDDRDSAFSHLETELPTYEIGVAYNLNGLVIGGSYRHNSKDASFTYKALPISNQTNSDWGSYILGVGSNQNNMSWEVGIQYDAEGKASSTKSVRGSRYGLFAGATKVIKGIELDTDLKYMTGDYLKNVDSDYSSIDFNFDAEFLISEIFYITPGLYYNKLEQNLNENKSLGLSADFGYRANKIDTTIGVDYQVDGETKTGQGTSDTDDFAWKIDVAYLF